MAVACVLFAPGCQDPATTTDTETSATSATGSSTTTGSASDSETATGAGSATETTTATHTTGETTGVTTGVTSGETSGVTTTTNTDGGNPYDGRPPLGLVVNTCPAIDGKEAEIIQSLAGDGADFYVQRVEFRQLDDPDFLALLQYALPWYKSLGYQVMLTIPTVDTAIRTMPDDVVDLPLDSPATLARFDAALEELLTPEVAASIDWISVGNEVDLYFGANPEDVAPFVTFADAAYAKLASLGVDAPHCVTFTQEGVEQDVAGAATALLPSCTFLPLTFYPMGDAAFQFLPPAEGVGVIASFAEIPGLPRVYQELGYVSAASNGGSPELQAEFLSGALTSVIGADVDAVSINWYCDHPIELCKDFVEHLYGVPPGAPDYDAFVGFVCSLGLVESDGTPKPAFSVFKEAIAATPG